MSGLLATMRATRRVADRRAGGLLAVGLTAVALYHALQWRADRDLARRRRAEWTVPRPPLKWTPQVSILVAAWNEAGNIERHLASVLALRYPALEYLLCAGGDDGTYSRAMRFERPGLTVLEQRPGEGKQAALRRCLERATGEVIYLTDADCLLDDDSFERTLAPALDGRADASSGGSRPLDDQLQRSALVAFNWAADLYVAAHAPRVGSGLLGRNAAVRRTALERAGGLRPAVRSGTDYHLARSLLALGLPIYQVPESRVATRFHESFERHARQQRRWLRNVVLHGSRSGARAEAALALQTSLVGLTMLLLPLATPLAGPAVLVLWLLALAHSALGKLRYLDLARALESGQRIRPLCLAVSAPLLSLAECAVWALPLLDYLSPVREEAW